MLSEFVNNKMDEYHDIDFPYLEATLMFGRFMLLMICIILDFILLPIEIIIWIIGKKLERR